MKTKTRTKKVAEAAKAAHPGTNGRISPNTIVAKVGDEEQHVNSEQPAVTGDRLKAEVLSDTQIKLDRAFAQWYLGLPIFDGERSVISGHVQELYDVMRQGTFNENQVIISTAVLKNKTYRINGQHTCWALMLMREGTSYQVRHVKYKVSNIEQLRLLYSTHDRLLPRTDAHLVKIQLVHTPEMVNIAPSTIQRLVPGLRMWLNERPSDQQRCNPQALSALARGPHNAVFRRVAEYYAKHVGTFPEIKRRGLLAALFANYNVAPTKAPEFWEPVITGLNLGAKTDARYALRDVITKSCMQQKGNSVGRRSLTAEDLYRIAVSMWNKWRENGTVHVAPRATATRIKAK